MTKSTYALWGVCLSLGLFNHFFVSGQGRLIIPFVLFPSLFLFWVISAYQFSEAIRASDPNLYHLFQFQFHGQYIKFAEEIIREKDQNDKILICAKTLLSFYRSAPLLLIVIAILSLS